MTFFLKNSLKAYLRPNLQKLIPFKKRLFREAKGISEKDVIREGQNRDIRIFWP